MDKAYDPKQVEEKIYRMWEAGGYFTPKIDKTKKPFTILLPPPNANADLHLGHAMYVTEDIMIRYHRMLGDPTLWEAGADHAGFETQFVFEKFLAKNGQSRFDFPRDELFRKIWDFVMSNRGHMENQLRRLGFSLDWTRNPFPLDPEIVNIVYRTFKKLYDDELLYRGKRMVNYCTRCGTGFSDLEVKHVEQNDPLYYIKYGPFILATVRPETKFGDTAVAVHPQDKRYQEYIGREITFESLIGPVKLKVVADEAVDPKFGTGVVKVTPAHDPNDYEIGLRHHLEVKQIIDFSGKLTSACGPYAGLRVKAARAKVVADMTERGMIDHVDEKYIHAIVTCYKCNTTLEPLPMEQWFIKVKPLTDKATNAVHKNQIKFVPPRFKKHTLTWLTNFHDWNISRQIVWGIRIPAWKCIDCSRNQKSKIKDQKSEWIVTHGDPPAKCPICGGNNLEQDSDVFDTWFSSGQWPFATLKAGKPGDFEYFYPTSVMETGYDILPWWVCRMIMLGIYTTGNVPFKTVYLHGLVRDNKGQKMSKSKGNVINPLDLVDKYGADALRFALIFGAGPGSDIAISDDKVRGMRNFANKLWNIARFVNMNLENPNLKSQIPNYNETLHQKFNSEDKRIISEINMLTAGVTKNLEKYRFSDAAKGIYDFAWHRIADVYLEENKERFKTGDREALITLVHVFKTILTLLHPFMPFVTEEIYESLPGGNGVPLIVSPWPGRAV